ncbi:MAG: CBS domain-containing protein [Fervidicoccaceae archaeon]
MSYSRKYDWHRWLRSDGQPGFSSRIYRVEGDMERLAKRPVITISQSSPVKEALERMHLNRVRSLIVSKGEAYEGILLAENLIDYLGGGDLYNLAINRYEGIFYRAIDEPIKSIMSKQAVFAYTTSRLSDVVTKMMENNISIIPILNRDGKIYGIISEHDVVKLLVEKRTGVTAEEISSQIISVGTYEPILEAMKKMVSLGLRQIFVRNEADQIVGSISIKRLIDFFATSEVYNWVKKGYLTEANSAQVKDLASYSITRIPHSLDVGEAAREMLNYQVSSAVVVKDSEDFGMITEHDVFYALALPLK